MTPLRRFFLPAARYPADPRALFILVLSVFSGITAFALRAAPRSLEEVMPHWAVMTWGILLSLGSLLALAGMAKQTLNGILLEQVGSVVVAAATIFYAGIALYVTGLHAAQTAGIILAWGLSCLVRWVQLQILIAEGVKQATKESTVREVCAEADRQAKLK